MAKKARGGWAIQTASGNSYRAYTFDQVIQTVTERCGTPFSIERREDAEPLTAARFVRPDGKIIATAEKK